MDFVENIRTSFTKVKESISALETRLETLENRFSEVQSRLDQLLKLQNNEDTAIDIPKKAKNAEFDVLRPPKPQITKSSTGNEGVPLRHCDDTATTDRHSTDTRQTNKISDYNDIQNLKKELNSRFLSLTEAQFRVFIAIYRLEEELDSSITYADVAKHLMISQSSVRDYVSDLILRKIPLTKEKSPNRKIYLSITKEFRNLKMLENLLALREKDYSQTQLTGHLRQFL